jgi:superfamily II DNA or RNA helicase
MGVQLREYQDEAIDAVRNAMRQHRRVLLCMPTGSGKTVCFCSVAERVWAKGLRVYALAHRIEIVKQISGALRANDIRHGVMAPDFRESTWSVQVGMVQTVVNRLDRIPRPDLLILDECHHAIAGTYKKVADAWSDVHTLGVTATPQRLDGRGLSEAFDVLVEGPDVKELMKLGFLCNYQYFAPPVVADLSALRVKMGDYMVADVVAAMDRQKVTGDAEANYRRLLNGKPAIAFCSSVAHAEHVAEQFRAAGWNAASVDGSMPSAERDRRITAIGNGGLNVLTSCQIVDEGTDLPVVAGALLLNPTQSLARHLQQVGRVLRPKPDGGDAIICDHVGNVMRHGMPDAARRWSLEGQKKNANKVAPAIRCCPKCYLAFRPAPKCPGCGYEFPAALTRGLASEIPVSADLQQMTGGWLETGPLDAVMKGRRTREEIDAVRRARGYHPNWTNVQLALRSGFRERGEGARRFA